MHSRALFAAGSLLALLAATPSLAQSTETQAANQPPEEQAAAEETGENVVVTAQLREQRPVEVPFALTTYSGRFLEDLNIQEFEDLARFTPGFAVQNQSPNNPAISIRGITVDSGFSYFEPRVSIYQDGVSIAAARRLCRAVRPRAGRDRQGPAIDPLRARRADRRGQHRPGQAAARRHVRHGPRRDGQSRLLAGRGDAQRRLSPKVGLRVAATRPATARSRACSPASTTSIRSRPARHAPSCASSRPRR